MRVYILKETLVPTLVIRSKRTIVEMQADWLGWLAFNPRIRVQRLVRDGTNQWFWRQAWSNRRF